MEVTQTILKAHWRLVMSLIQDFSVWLFDLQPRSTEQVKAQSRQRIGKRTMRCMAIP